VIVQNYKIKNSHITIAYSKWINHLISVIDNIDRNWINSSMISLRRNIRVIPLIPNQGQLVVVSGQISTPLPFMNASNLPTNVSLSWAENNIRKICQRLDDLISALEMLPESI